MVDWTLYFISLGAVAGLAVIAWLYSLARRNVGIVDSLWSLMILAVLAVYVLQAGLSGARATLVLVLLSLWAVRLSLHITVRNHGEPEDRRYRAIRANNEPNFELKSLYIVFGLQAFLATHGLLKAVTEYQLIECWQSRDCRQQEGPAKLLAMPVDTEIEYDRDQPCTKTGISPDIIFARTPEAVFGQFLANKQKTLIFPLLLEFELTRRLHDQRSVPVQNLSPGKTGVGGFQFAQQTDIRFLRYALTWTPVRHAISHTTHDRPGNGKRVHAGSDYGGRPCFYYSKG